MLAEMGEEVVEDNAARGGRANNEAYHSNRFLTAMCEAMDSSK